jgi:Protein of unknown function (DUF1071)
MSELLKINVNDHTEKKGQLTYLSWAWAWAEVLKLDPAATWDVCEFNGLPMVVMPDTTAMVKVSATIKGDKKTSWLPVMDNRNKAIQGPDAFQVNTAIMRCLAKAIAMHGLGLYIYAGEDLPESEPKPKGSPITVAQEEYDFLPPARQKIIEAVANAVIDLYNADDVVGAYGEYIGVTDQGERAALFKFIPVEIRKALRKHDDSLKGK